jgi:hypothetical protein
MERKGRFSLPDGRTIDAETLAKEYNIDWDDVVNIALQILNPEKGPEIFSDYEAVVRTLVIFTEYEDLENLGLGIFNEVNKHPVFKATETPLKSGRIIF